MKPNLKNPVHFFAFGFGSGLLKPASGTWGSLAGFLISILIWELSKSQTLFIALSLIGFIVGCFICEKASQDLKVHDDSRIVWDEIVAVFLIFAFLPQYDWKFYALAFIGFRFFDILKPFPIKYFDKKMENGFGIMIDDVLAAVYTIILVYFII